MNRAQRRQAARQERLAIKETRVMVIGDNPELAGGRDLALISEFIRQSGPHLWDACIQHDDECPRLANSGPCNCNVEILLTSLEDGRRLRLRWAQGGIS